MITTWDTVILGRYNVGLVLKVDKGIYSSALRGHHYGADKDVIYRIGALGDTMRTAKDSTVVMSS